MRLPARWRVLAHEVIDEQRMSSRRSRSGGNVNGMTFSR
jgi:hypothetical protein